MDFQKLVMAVMTVDREPAYVHQTLASLFASGPMIHEVSPVHLMIDAADASYLAAYRHHRELRLHPLSDAEHDRVGKWGRHRRFCHNYVRCLSLPVPEGGGICVCEDDLIFRDLFVQRLLMTIAELEAHTATADHCLALYTDCDLEQEPSFYRGRYFCSYGRPFHGTQCMYYPRQTALAVRDYLKEHGVEKTEDCGDLLIGKLCRDKMYACPRALADHAGVISTGLGGSGRAPTFGRPFRPIRPDEWGQGV